MSHEDIYTQQIYDYKVTPGNTKYIPLQFWGRDQLPVDLSLYNIYFAVFNPQTKAVIPMAVGGSATFSLRNRVPADYSSDPYEGIYRYGDTRAALEPPAYLVDNLDVINKIIIELTPTWSDKLTPGLIYPFNIQLVAATGESFIPARGNVVATEGQVE